MDDLPTGYYLDNFNYLLDYVEPHYADLLTEEESCYRIKFQCLSQDAQRLYVRLYGRRGPYFRMDKLRYDEIDDLRAASTELLKGEFLTIPDEPEIFVLLSLLTKPELLNAFPEIDRRLLRRDVETFIFDRYSSTEIKNKLDLDFVALAGLELMTTYRLLFFGNLHQDFSEFILRDLGLTPFEDYKMDPSARYFDDRAILDATLVSYALDDRCFEILEQKNLNSLRAFTDSYLQIQNWSESRLQSRFDRTCNRVAREYERYKKDDLALSLYQRNEEAPSRERQARIYAKRNEVKASASICKCIYLSPKTESEKEFSHNFARRLNKKHDLALDWLPPVVNDEFTVIEIEIDKDENVSVEMLTATWFESRGDQSWYVENTLIPGIFGLYFWDIIFLSIKGVFFNPFQRGPADLFSLDFCQSRLELIQQRLDLLLVDEKFQSTILNIFSEKIPRANYFVSWNWLDLELLKLALDRIPRDHFHKLFKRLLSDLRHNCSGLPDLVVFPKAGGYFFSEVKGPGDRLQESQKRWFRFFSESEIPASIVNVNWQQTQN